MIFQLFRETYPSLPIKIYLLKRNYKMYFVRLIDCTGFAGYLTYRDRTSWCKRTAIKHANEFIQKFGGSFILEKI